MRLVQAGLIGVLVLVAACENTGLHALRRPGEGPDEFRILPGEPLRPPADYDALPVPTPGGPNLTDPSPLQDSAARLGGQRRSAEGPVPAGDASLVAHASRLGRDPAIRQQLAEEDADFRRRRARFTQYRIVPVDRYNEAYRREALDAKQEQLRWRRAGIPTPSAPPTGYAR